MELDFENFKEAMSLAKKIKKHRIPDTNTQRYLVFVFDKDNNRDIEIAE